MKGSIQSKLIDWLTNPYQPLSYISLYQFLLNLPCQMAKHFPKKSQYLKCISNSATHWFQKCNHWKNLKFFLRSPRLLFEIWSNQDTKVTFNSTKLIINRIFWHFDLGDLKNGLTNGSDLKLPIFSLYFSAASEDRC